MNVLCVYYLCSVLAAPEVSLCHLKAAAGSRFLTAGGAVNLCDSVSRNLGALQAEIVHEESS